MTESTASLPPAFLSPANIAGLETPFELRFNDTALGPFGTIFGGMTAGVLVDRARQSGPDGAQVASISLDFVRPCSPGMVEITSEIVQQGRRTTLFSLQMKQGGKLATQAKVTLVQPIELSGLPVGPPSDWAEQDPRQYPEPKQPKFPTAWSGDLLEVRVDEARGIRWLRRYNVPLMPLTNSGFAVAMADYAAGSSRPDSWERPVVQAFPNPNLFVALLREPRGEWVGLRASSVWDGAGVGLTRSELLDADGLCGFAQMFCLLIPLKSAART
jgi:hypothetical protein